MKMYDVRISKMKRIKLHIIRLFVLLLFCGVVNEMWAIKAYYHILTLPINTSTNTYHMADGFDGYRLEAVRVMVDNAQIVELPAAYKSPLATNFKYYYDGDNVEKQDAISMYSFSTKNKSRRYKILNTALNTEEKTAITSAKDVHIYVTYDYDDSKGIKLDGSVNYNIPISGGFLALNRGRNNRLAVISETSGLVSAEDLVSEDFVQLPYANDKVSGTNISAYWSGNQNTREEVAGQFHFLFKFEGSDPYNILIGTAYNKDDTYIESHNGEAMVYKWYKGAHLFKPSDDNFFLASDDHKQYTKAATKVNNKYPKPNPTVITHDDTKTGYFHNKGGNLNYNTFALLNNSDGNGYVFMISRFIGDNGDLSNPSDYKSAKYYFLVSDGNYNNLTYSSMTLSSASSSYSTDKKIYPISNVNFKVKTPFYALATTDGEKEAHTVTAVAQLSQYTIDNDDISKEFIPDELKRKYCTFTTFRNSAGTIITKYKDAYNSTTGGYDVYVDYVVQNPLFTAITPQSSYTAAELNAAAWYELTDDGSTEASGKKLQVYQEAAVYKFKNNGVSGTYNKTSEYAFIGDPYELRVILRSKAANTDSPLGPHYVGAAETSAGTAFTVGASDAGAGYKWEIPDDATAGSFRMRIFSTNSSGTGYWSWDTGNASIDVTYGTTPVAGPTLTSNPQTITLNVTGLTYAPENYLVVEETTVPSSGQVGTITIGDISSAGAATITVAIAANTSGANKAFTLTITEKDAGGLTVKTATAVNITQGTTAYTGGNVQYNTTATRVKVLTLPTRTFTYKIVDKSGRIAVKASIDQTIFMPLSTTVSQTLETCLPPNIVSPYLVGETLSFYDTYGGTGRGSLSGAITETPNADDDIFVKYTTSYLDLKPYNLSEEQEFNVMLNGQYIYYDSSDKSIKSTEEVDNTSKNYFWKLRNRDPYHMLIDNMGARIDMSVDDKTENPDVYADNGAKTNPERQMGAWVISGIPTSVSAGSTTYVNLSKDAILSISIVVRGLTEGSSLSVNEPGGKLSSISVSPTNVTAAGTATITATLANTESRVSSTITLTESGSHPTTTKIVLIQDKECLGFTTSRLSAQQFIAKAGLQGGVYEVMMASGGGDGDPDARTTYYNIGRSSTTEIKIYDNATYAHGNPMLKFQLQQSVDYQYHLIDLAKHKLLTQPSNSAELVLPAEYQSPLVGLENYNYYARDQITISNMGTDDASDDEYEPIPSAVKLSSLTDLDAKFTTTPSAPGEWNSAGTNYKKTATDLDEMKRQAKQLTEATDYYYKVGESDYYKVTVTRAFRGLDIYVTYKANDRVKFNDKTSPYMLKFLNPYPNGYYLEDGKDKLIPYVAPATDPKEGKIQAVYPYCNGDGSLFIYGEAMQKEQFNGGASTRPRWIWFFESKNSDPYHVMIHSNNTIKHNGVDHPTYLQTYAVDFVQGATKQIVTCGTLPTAGSEDITEYMVLGTVEENGKGHYKLRTTNLIEGARRDVTSLEQYWKTYDMIKKFVLEIDTKEGTYKDEFSNVESTWVVPTELRVELQSKLGELHVGTGKWHSYAIYANAVRWNGYNDKTDGHEKKCVQKLEHWFQTFEMGDGTFDIESATIPPVLVLLDRHGWEIMRKPLPNITSYPEGPELDDLKVYDSPMVKEYKFYSNATKATGCHKYSLRMQDGAERDQIMDGGKHYTSKSLALLPPKEATGVISGGALQDQYVTYTVKDEYENSYSYNFVDYGDGEFTETGTASKFLMVQNGRFYKNRNSNDSGRESYISKPIFEHTNPEGGNVYDMIVAPHANNNIEIVTEDGKIANQCLWYIGPNLNIDKEMGIKYAAEAGGTGEPLTEYETKKNYFETGKGGFDPYNIQLKNVGTDLFMTSHMTKTELKDGAMLGTYTNTRITLEEEDTTYPADPLVSTGSEGYDHTNIAMTNQTFMAVSDANGNMQLMPRFDHDRRVNVPTTAPNNDPWPTTLEKSVDYDGEAKVDDNSKMGPQTTFFVRPQRFIYRIIDNDGNEALRYKRAGDYYPTISDHFMSPLATDFKFYYDHAAYTSSVSSEAAYVAAASPTAFQKTATDEANMVSQAKLLEVLEDYYFKIGAGTTESPYTYKKVTVTKIHSGTTEATYTTTNCKETDWTNAIVHKEARVSNLDALKTAINNLEVAGNYYYEIGPYVKDAKSTYIYRKIVVKSVNSNFLSDVHNKRDISAKEITGQALAGFDFDGDECQVFVRYSYNEGADLDGDKILQGKWFTIKLDDKDVIASGALAFHKTVVGESEYTTAKTALSGKPDGDYYFRISDGEEEPTYTYKKVTITSGSPAAGSEDSSESEWTTTLGSGVSLFTGVKPATSEDLRVAHEWHWKFLTAPTDPSSDYYVAPDPYAIQIFNRQANYTTDLTLDPNPMSVPIKVNGKDRFSLLNHQSGGYALAVNGLETYTYDFLNGKNMTTSVGATTTEEVNYQRTVANYDEGGFEAARTALSGQADGLYVFKVYDDKKNASYKKVTVTGGTPGEGVTSLEDEWNGAYHFTSKSGVLSPDVQLVLNNDVTHNYTYKVINNGGADYIVDNPGYLAVEATQDNATASSNGYVPYLPEAAQTPLLDKKKDDESEENYLYYGSASLSDGKYTVAPQTKLFTLYGLYDDVVYVRYKKYDMDKTGFKIPNEKAIVASHVARGEGSQDVSMNIKGELPYNIIWYNDNMMSTEGDETTTITDGGSQTLSGLKKHVWYFEGGDPYALKIRHKESSNYVNGTTTLTANAADAKQFMLLKKSGYDYGILQIIGTTGTDAGKKLTGYGQTTTTGDPTKFVIFGLSVHDLIYRLIIAKTCTKEEEEKDRARTAAADPSKYVDIPYMTEVSGTPGTKRIYGSTQRDLESIKDESDDKRMPGDKYQLGKTLTWGGTNHTYSHDAGTVSIGDVLEVPREFYRPNCTFEFYIQDIYGSDNTTVQTALNNKYKGLKLKNLMSDADLIDKTVVVNVVYSFDQDVATNTGLDFVRSVGQNLWYTFETKNGSTPYLAHYTNAWGLQSMEGRNTRYTNDYLWTPLGDVYGFKMYNRYMIKNSGTSNKVMTFAGDVANNKKLVVAEPGDLVPPSGPAKYTEGNEIFELLATEDLTSGYFYVHPVVNNTGTQYYVWRKDTSGDIDGDDKDDLDYTILSTTPCEWTYGLGMTLLEPYYDRAGYVGGLTTTAKKPDVQPKSGKTLYEEALAREPFKITDLQAVVYDDNNITDFSTGYYRLHSVPGTPGISPVRYASGYLHETEKTAGTSSTPIPMHFYSKEGVTGTFDGATNPLASDLTKGYTETPATRGDIPVPATEDDPSTIFYLKRGISPYDKDEGGNPRVTMSTQGLYVKGNATTTDTGDAVMTATEGEATTFSLIDIGGAVLLITNELEPSTRNYLHYGQSGNIYDLKYFHNSPTNEARWCIEPANNKGLQVAVNNGGDDYYYSTFCAPFDVLLPENDGTKTYYAYICDKWNNTNLHPQKVPEVTGTTSYDEGKFVPAGTPVILRVKDESGSMKLTLPNNAPTTISDPTNPLTKNIFSGKYLEQKLGSGSDVYTLGLPFISHVEKDDDYNTTGDIDAPLPEQATSGLGFYINATANKENGEIKARWDKNNRYVIHNKIYYRAGSSGSSAPQQKGPEFVPVIFDDLEEQDEELNPNGAREIVGDGCIYDLMGRKVATREQVEDGSWKQRVATGIYILNGKKFQKK